MDLKNKEWKKRIEKKTEDYKVAFQEQGMAGLSQALSTDLDGWNNEKINIAVLGQSGTGKSSFINAVLDLSADDEGAAAVGVSATTSALHFYRHPRNRNFIIWDFPGVGTKSFPKEEYLFLADFRRFDFFILLASKRFTENDIWLACAIEMTKKSFYFVRTQFGNDLENECKKQKKKKNVQSEIEPILKDKVLEDCSQHLDSKNINYEGRIFVIDSYEKNRFDFSKLEARIINDAFKLSEQKQVAIALSLSAVTKPAIEEKKILLEERIPKVALRAAFALRVLMSDVRGLQEEREFYRKQFNLDATSLQKDADASNIQEMLSDMELKLYHRESQLSASEELMSEVDKLIPFLFPFNIVKSYKASKLFLRKCLDSTAEAAVDINETMIKGLSDNN